MVDKSQCIHFEAYSTMQSFEAAENPLNYTDAQLADIPLGLSYTNNPNTGYEGRADPDGKEHVLRPAHD